MASAAPATDRAVTRATLIEDLHALGLPAGAVVLVHAALSRVGTVYGGGTQAVIEALLEVLGPEGTLMMPAHSGDLSEPTHWQAPPAPPGTADAIRDAMPAWDPARTPTREMGILAEHFRHWPGVMRSDHPQVSFAALGPAAGDPLATHRTGDGLGESSPIGRLYALDGQVLLIGVGHGNDTSLHLAEYRAGWPSKRTHLEGAPRLVDGVRRWTTFEELVWTDDDFETIGAAFESGGESGGESGRESGGESGGETSGAAVHIGRVGAAGTRRFRQRPLVDFATAWMAAHRR